MVGSGNTQFIRRPRVEAILGRAARSKLVYIVAGAGYGKTQTVHDYIERQKDAVVRWVQLTESDNAGARYWEHLTHNISTDNPELAERLREFGFPETLARFKQFAEILRSTEHRSHKTFLVLDDFHVINSEQALLFAERCAHLNIPGACVVIISRTEPKINAVSLFAKGLADRLTEEDLRFTEDEVAAYFEAKGMTCTSKDITAIISATKGWALAISLFSIVLQKTQMNMQIALDTVKQNIFKIMQSEAWLELSEHVKKTLVKLSLIPELPLRLLRESFSDTLLLQEVPQLAPFIWFDSFTGQYRIHPLYREFLCTKEDILTTQEKYDTYLEVAQWCFENSFLSDGIKYLAASKQYSRMLRKLLTYPHRLPADTCSYYFNILDNMEVSSDDAEDMSYLLLIHIFTPLLLAGMSRYDEAVQRCYDVIEQRENRDDPASLLVLGVAYSNLAYLDMFTCTVTHEYNAPKHLNKAAQLMAQYTEKTGTPPGEVTGAFAIADIRSFACLVGEGAAIEEFDEFLDMTKQTAAHITSTAGSMYYGYDDLVACELAFYREKPNAAKRYAFDAILKAREKNQHSIEAMAAMYLFRIAMLEGNYTMVKELFKDKEGSPDSPFFWNRKFLYELGIGLLYAQIGLPKMVPAWLISDDKETAYEVSSPVRELICSAKYLISMKKYDTALTSLCNAYPRAPYDRFLFGELTLTLLTAVARLKTGDKDGAVRDFEKAYRLSYDGEFVLPFIELGRELQPLINAVSAQTQGTGVPAAWLLSIKKKASVYIKKTTVIYNAFKAEHNVAGIIELSNREHEVLTDLYHGLSRDEIAMSRQLSVNTVHKTIQSIYLKLDAYGIADAIRIAIDKQLLD